MQAFPDSRHFSKHNTTNTDFEISVGQSDITHNKTGSLGPDYHADPYRSLRTQTPVSLAADGGQERQSSFRRHTSAHGIPQLS